MTAELAHTLPAELSPEAGELLSRMLGAQCYRELGAMRLFASALAFTRDEPGLATLQREVADERRHLHAALALWSQVCATTPEQLLVRTEQRLAAHPFPALGSALDLAVMRFLFDRAGYFQLREYQRSTFLPYRVLVAEILGDESLHGAEGARALAALCAGGDGARAQVKIAVDQWLPIALTSFGRPDSPGDRRAVALGLKPRGSGAVRSDFIADVAPLLESIGVPAGGGA